MGTNIDISAVQARLSDPIDCVERGEQFVIERDGRPVAELRPIFSVSTEELVARIRAIAKRVELRNQNGGPWPPTGQSIRDVALDRHRSP